MNAAPPGGAEESLLLAAFIGLLIVRRAVLQLRGAPLSTARLVGYALLYPLLFALVAGLESLPLLPLWSLGVDVAAAAVGAWAAVSYVERTVVVYSEGGRWMYRLGLVVPLVYVGLFLGRLALELAVGIDPFAPSITALSPTNTLLLEVVDALFGFSTGMAVGRNLGVYRAWQRRLAQSTPAPLRSEPS